MDFKNAIVRLPGKNFVDGLSSFQFGKPGLNKALKQHEFYRDALKKCGLSVMVLEPDLVFPDSTFVEDTAVLTADLAVLTRPGAPSRMGEVESIRREIVKYYDQIATIESPGTVDGGDICLRLVVLRGENQLRRPADRPVQPPDEQPPAGQEQELVTAG